MSVYFEMDGLFPLLQTVLWVGLIVGLAWRYHQHSQGILSAVQKRIETGSGVKAGWLEIQAPVLPQDAQQQVARIDQEVAEIVGEESAAIAPITSTADENSKRSIKSRYLTAEDLAFREIQSEFGVPVSRQVRIGPNRLDGFFTSAGSGYAVEVKYVKNLVNRSTLQHAVLDSGLKV